MGRPVTGFGYLDDAPGVIALAHRGGAGHPALRGRENTAEAFAHAAALGYGYFETDVHATRDGEVVVFHDDSLDRVTDGTGAIGTRTAAELREVRIGGTAPIPRLVDLLEQFPRHRFNIDVKAPDAVEPLARLVQRLGAEDRVCVGAFTSQRIDHFRRLTGGRIPTAAAPREVAAFLAAPGGLARLLTRGRVAVLQVPRRQGPIPVVTRHLVRAAHAARAQVHVWTVDDPAEMEQLLDLGVDGLVSDRTDLLKQVLRSRGVWQHFA
jgi:glycerophosphoryl diester phosphodiesterase